MSATDTSAQRTAPGLLLGVFGSAIFLSAALLFVVQPMFTKMVLPRFGGSPSVWSVAMVFFQAVLLGGYAYAHAITRLLPTRLAVPLHVALMVVATFWLPLAIASGWGRPPSEGATGWLLGLFLVSIGLPFFALSANGPLLQAWFARTRHRDAKDPYFLYGASNVGSFLALISYPLLIEPFTKLGEQTGAWAVGFYVLIVLIAASGMTQSSGTAATSVEICAVTAISSAEGTAASATQVAASRQPGAAASVAPSGSAGSSLGERKSRTPLAAISTINT